MNRSTTADDALTRLVNNMREMGIPHDEAMQRVIHDLRI